MRRKPKQRLLKKQHSDDEYDSNHHEESKDDNDINDDEDNEAGTSLYRQHILSIIVGDEDCPTYIVLLNQFGEVIDRQILHYMKTIVKITPGTIPNNKIKNYNLQKSRKI